MIRSPGPAGAEPTGVAAEGQSRAGAPVVLLANRRAGRSARLDVALAALEEAGRPVEVVEAGDGAALADALAGAPGATVVAAGGDGTLHRLVRQLREMEALAGTVVGLLPLGTGNDLARTLGIPLDPRGAVEVLLRGAPRALDLLVDDAGGAAVNAVHAGIGGLAAHRAAPLKPLLGKMAYAVGAAAAGARCPGWRMRVEVDGSTLAEGQLLLVGLGNGRTIGGGTSLWPAARPDDGFVDVVVARAGGLLPRLRLAGGLRRGDPGRVGGVVLGRGRSVRIEGEPIPYNVDGEVEPARADRCWEVQRGAWRLLAPPAAEPAGG